MNIETYSISQTTLEQVFLSFASNQINSNSNSMNNSKSESINSNSQLPIFTSLDTIDSDTYAKRFKKTESKKLKIFKAKLVVNI